MVQRDQLLLMPPSVAEWLPEGHLAWFVLDVVEQLDLSGFRARYRVDGRGGAAYDPAVMVAVLVYGYCLGDRSSRRIERRLVEDVAYRVVAANAQPDHATIARFRADHETAIEDLFGQVLALCVAAGLVKVGVVALDGTKMEAAAAKAANLDDERLRQAMRAEARRILEEAKAVDAAEDEQFGEARGDELPPELADRSRRLVRLRQAKARLDEAQAERDAREAATAAKREADAAAGRKPRGRKPTKPVPDQKPLLVNTTDPESRLMKIPGGFCQGYNAQAVASEDQVIVAAELSDRAVDSDQFEPMLAATRANLAAAGVGCPIQTLLADAGYYSTANATLDTDIDVLIAPRKAHKLPTEPLEAPPDEVAATDRAEAELVAHRAVVFEQIAAGDLTLAQAATELGLARSTMKTLWWRYSHHGPGVLVRKRRANGEGLHPRHRTQPDTKARMEARLASEHGRTLYRRRAQIIEPVFGQIKDPRGIRRFQRRGLNACASEWKLITATHNLLKLWRHGHTSLAGC